MGPGRPKKSFLFPRNTALSKCCGSLFHDLLKFKVGSCTHLGQNVYTINLPTNNITRAVVTACRWMLYTTHDAPRCLLCGPPPRRGPQNASHSVCLSVRPVRRCTLFTVAPSYERTSKIEKLQFSLMGQRHVCTFWHALRAAYRTAILAAQILVSTYYDVESNKPQFLPPVCSELWKVISGLH